MKPLSLPQSPDRPRVLSARADLGYRRQMHPNALEIDRRVERQQPPLVELDSCDEQIELRARNDHADIDEFLALDYLPGSVTFDPVSETPAADLASAIVWFDSLVTNVDRTARNPNMLMWHRKLWLIDHGAALYFHHAWDDDYLAHSRTPFPPIKDHVLLPFAADLEAADRLMAQRVTPEAIATVVGLLPEQWLAGDSAGAPRDPNVYARYLTGRLEARPAFLEEALRARSFHV